MTDREFLDNLRLPEGNNGLKVADFMRKNNAYMYDEILSILNEYSIYHLLEVGCATADHAIAFTKRLHLASYTGLDASDTMIQSCRQRFLNDKRLKFKQGTIENFKSELSYDCIVLVNLWYFITDREQVLKTLNDSLSEDGIIILSVKTSRTVSLTKNDGFIIQSPAELLTELNKFGFIEDIINYAVIGEYDCLTITGRLK